MSAWGDALSPQARADVQGLVDAAIAAGRQALSGAEVIEPIPFLLSTNGQLLRLSADSAPGTPLPVLAEQAIAKLRTVGPAARAVGLVTTTHTAKGATLEIWVEHAEGAALTLRQPYKRSLLGGVVEFEPLAAYPGERRVWG
jgi:hypothetical protein